MKNILEQFLDEIEVNYTRWFADKLYNEHPHKYNMYGLKRMLDVYGVKTLGVHCNHADLLSLTYPCILHTHRNFVIGLDCNESITYLQQGRKLTLSIEKFKQIWSGNALVVEETTEATEPNYREHQQEEIIAKIKSFSIPIILALAVIIGLITNGDNIGVFDIIRMLLASVGILICSLLMEKQLLEVSRYGDRVCSLFSHSDCNSVLDGTMAKVFGISWSEVGLGYFIANVLLLSLFPDSSDVVAIINWIAMPYGIWSIHYQWRMGKNWCVLCVITQVVIWLMGIVAMTTYLTTSFICNITDVLLSCIVFAMSILIVHQCASTYSSKKERMRAVQQYRAFKADNVVAKALIEKGEYHGTTLDDSSIIFGNPKAEILVTILSNPHCNPCARMHRQVENLLSIHKDEICIQYIFSFFNETLKDSNRYLIGVYQKQGQQKAREIYSSWYEKDKDKYKEIWEKYTYVIHSETIEIEMQKHLEWKRRTGFTATPTILVNGYELPHEYELTDLAMIVNFSITEKNIMQDINGRSTTPLGAEWPSAEETV